MNCQAARPTFPELLDSRTLATAHPEARAHLATCLECQREFAALEQTLAQLDALPVEVPSARLRTNFQAMLRAEQAATTHAHQKRTPHPPLATAHRLLRWLFLPLTGAALAALGFVAGTRYAPIPSAPAPATSPIAAVADVAAHQKIAELERKLNTMGQLVGYSLLQQQQRPTNDRLRRVLTSASSASEHPDDQVINELISALALDPSANVRLRAVDALFPHADQDVVRAGILAYLPREQNPLVQVSMIDFLTAARDAEARPALERLSLSETSDRSVRDAARRALTQF